MQQLLFAASLEKSRKSRPTARGNSPGRYRRESASCNSSRKNAGRELLSPGCAHAHITVHPPQAHFFSLARSRVASADGSSSRSCSELVYVQRLLGGKRRRRLICLLSFIYTIFTPLYLSHARARARVYDFIAQFAVRCAFITLPFYRAAFILVFYVNATNKLVEIIARN